MSITSSKKDRLKVWNRNTALKQQILVLNVKVLDNEVNEGSGRAVDLLNDLTR